MRQHEADVHPDANGHACRPRAGMHGRPTVRTRSYVGKLPHSGCAEHAAAISQHGELFGRKPISVSRVIVRPQEASVVEVRYA